eukprot:IDg10373t1
MSGLQRCVVYLPLYQLLSAYIESVDSHIRLYLRDACEDKRHITLFELCRKPANQGETLHPKPKTLQDQPPKPLGVVLWDVNAIDGNRT